jgi:hypothetical protein
VPIAEKLASYLKTQQLTKSTRDGIANLPMG